MTINAVQLCKSYSGVPAVNGLNLTLAPREVVGLLGPNGAGKSTTLGMLYGLVVPDSGTVTIENFNVLENGRAARRFLGVVSQDDNPDPEFTVEENIILFARYYGLNSSRAYTRTQELLERFDLTKQSTKLPDELSGGMRKRLSIARALVGEPKYLFLDEPTAGLDPEARLDLWKLIVALRNDDVGILLTTHYMEEAERLADRVSVLHHGEIVASGQTTDLISKHLSGIILEVDGVISEAVSKIALTHDTPMRQYGTTFAIAVPEHELAELRSALSDLNPRRLSERRPNLEDLFLKLTGESLE